MSVWTTKTNSVENTEYSIHENINNSELGDLWHNDHDSDSDPDEVSVKLRVHPNSNGSNAEKTKKQLENENGFRSRN